MAEELQMPKGISIPSAISSLATKKFVVVCRLPPNFELPRFPRVFNRSPVLSIGRRKTPFPAHLPGSR